MYLNGSGDHGQSGGWCLTITWDVFEYQSEVYSGMYGRFNYNMGCIWICFLWWRQTWRALFNYNMGCIWMAVMAGENAANSSLTITWDVFEYRTTNIHPRKYPFNYNMGCIWMRLCPLIMSLFPKFNYNMGCIWIGQDGSQEGGWGSLTITWDVFEWSSLYVSPARSTFNYNMGCIWINCFSFKIYEPIRFNYNMGCIWIRQKTAKEDKPCDV